VRSDDDRRRVAVLQGRLDVDEVIAELQADGRSTSAMLCTCKWLCGPRMTAAAFGIVMAAQKVSEGDPGTWSRKTAGTGLPPSTCGSA
jgi:hypothetical protein